MTKAKKSGYFIISLLEYLRFSFRNIISAIAMFWIFGILFEMIAGLPKQDYTMFMTYAQISLTFFGFTLVSGIFELRKAVEDSEQSKIIRKLFYLSITFLFATMSFLFLYSTSFATLTGKIMQMLLAFQVFFLITGVLSLVYGIIYSFVVLFDYLIFIEKKHRKIKEYKISIAGEWIIAIIVTILGAFLILWLYTNVFG